MTHRLLLLIATLVASATPLRAQTPSPPPVEFLPRAVLHMSAELLSGTADPRLRWDADFGGEIDVIDYGAGRVTFAANYEVVLGNELRRFDPNQGNYILEGSATTRLMPIEFGAVFYHQSRHMSDRDKVFPIDWNMLGVRGERRFLLGATHMHARADFRGTLKRSFVDYRWEVDGRLRADHVLRPSVGLFAGGMVRHLGVDGSRRRGGQTGFRAEGGVRVEGGAAALELFAAAERRIDPYPLEFSTATWATAGFRLVTR